MLLLALTQSYTLICMPGALNGCLQSAAMWEQGRLLLRAQVQEGGGREGGGAGEGGAALSMAMTICALIVFWETDEARP